MTNPAPSVPSESLPYATFATNRGAPVAPAVWLGIFGLALICLGGCFLIGIMATIEPALVFGPMKTNSMAMTPAVILFLSVLYVACFGCFAAAILLLVRSVQSLLLLLTR